MAARKLMGTDERTRPRGLTPRIRQMIDAMVFEGGSRDQAAVKVGLTMRAGRAAMRKAEVLNHYHAQLDVLRNSEKARNFHRLVELRDQDDNRAAAVSAARTISEIVDDGRSPGMRQMISPGFVIQVNNHLLPTASPAPALPAPAPMSEHEPTPTFESDDAVLWLEGPDV